MLFLAGGFFFLNVLNFSVCGFVSGGGGDVVWVRGGFWGNEMVLVVCFLVEWGGGEGSLWWLMGGCL